ncbi:MAG: murein biosynthesis integral membrane protein MurJ [Planctomycetota bacterium]|nr:murein biosynthesis integral membrane protein MurJ [Planctomycetota bacterium]
METESPKPQIQQDLTQRHKRLGLRTVWISAMTLVSRILGFIRESLSAALFGNVSPVFDAFITAWRIPNVFRRFLGEGALSTSFQTALTEVDAERGNRAGAALFKATATRLLIILTLLTTVMTALALWVPDTMPLTGWAWLGSNPEPVHELAARVMPYLILICLAALVSGGLQVRGHFTAPALAPAVMNMAWISTLLVIGWRFGFEDATGGPESAARHMSMARWLAAGVLIAGTVQLGVQVPALFKTGLLGVSSGSEVISKDAVRAVLWSSLPMALGAAVYQINVMIDGLMALGLLPTGGATIHYFANRVQQFPMALVAVAATSAVFPALKAMGHRGDLKAVRTLHDSTHRNVAFFALPASIGLFVLAEPVLQVLFQRGAFAEEGVVRGASALRMLCLAILPAGATGLCARTYYALGDFVHPVRISILMLITNVGLNLLLILQFGMDVDGLSLATAISSWGTLLLLLPGLSKRLPKPSGGTLQGIAIMLIPAAACGLAAHFSWPVLTAVLPAPIALACAIGAGGLSYGLIAVALRLPEARRILSRGR